LNFTAKTIYQGTVAYHNLIIEDFDRDDDPDIMALGTELVLFENDGQENFSVRNTVAVNIDQSDRYASGDIDDDGDTDVLVTRSSSPQELILYVNGGFASFDEVIINNLPTSINDIEILDADLDGDMDIMASGMTHLLYENDGNENFQVTSIDLPLFSTKTVTSDVNNDGVTDVVTVGSSFGWLNNNGNSNMEFRMVGETGSSYFHMMVDSDGDSDLDIFASYNSVDFSQLTVYKNDGNGRFNPDHFYYTEIDLGDVQFVDLDNDSDMDFISFNSGIFSFENDGNNNSTQRSIATSQSGLSFSTSDVNNDGYQDLLYLDLSSNSELILYLNDGAHNFTPQTIAENSDQDIILAFYADFDLDGNMDILVVDDYSPGSYGVFLYSNDGLANFTASFLTNIGDIPDKSRMQAEDFDLDGDIDFVLGRDGLYEELFWIENVNGTYFREHRLSSLHSFDIEFKITDLDSDGDMDIIQRQRTSGEDHIIGWYNNNGSGSFNWGVMANFNNIFWHLFGGDVTGDGRKDILTVEFQSFGGPGYDGSVSPNFLIFENLDPSTAISDETPVVPSELLLHQNYPNPFNPSTTIAFDLAVASEVTLTVYDIQGRKVATLLNEPRVPGYHEVDFDASNLTSGVYVYRLNAGNFSEARKMLLIR
ncbi:MAG: T9SS type A sorting domain-containing protein, partial [Calditrichota bacterium]